MPHWPASIRYRAIGMLEAGLTRQAVSARLSVPTRTLRRWWMRFEEGGAVERREGSGRRRDVSGRSGRRLVRLSRREPFHSSTQLSSSLDVDVSRRTIRRHLVRAGLRSRRVLRRPLLTPRHRQARMRWAMTRCHFREPQWRRIIFTDESRFLLRSVDGRMRVRRYEGEVLRNDLICETTQQGGGSVMVWGGICSDGRTSLVVLPTSLNGPRYRQLLQEHLLPWAEELLGPRETAWKLQDDNAAPHRSRVVQDFLDQSGVRRIEWPARSPDLNPIEHLWDEMGRRVRQRDPPVSSLTELANALREVWEAIPQTVIQTLIRSMPRRLHQVLRTRGGHTSY